VAFRTDKNGIRRLFPVDTGIDSATHWHYRNEAGLAALTERFEREYGDHTRTPGEPPNMMVRLVEPDEVSELNPNPTKGSRP